MTMRCVNSRRTRGRLTIVFCLLLLMLPGLAHADRLWKEGDDSLCGDVKRKPFQKHDLVTIVVEERSMASTSADTTTDNRTRWEAILNQWIRFSTDEKTKELKVKDALGTFVPEIDLDARLRHDATGKTTRAGSLTGKLTARVAEVMPNGTLVLEARKTRVVNEEKEIFTLTGIVRQEDVATDNTVKSERIADVNIRYEGVGSVGNAQKRGLLSRLLEWLWPF